MADKRILATEYVTGYGHATKEDTLNRLSMVEHFSSGVHNFANISFTLTVTTPASGLSVACADKYCYRIGDMVFLTCKLTFTGASLYGSGITLSGLPYTCAADIPITIQSQAGMFADVFNGAKFESGTKTITTGSINTNNGLIMWISGWYPTSETAS